MTDRTGELWDDEAATFDEQPDHGLNDPAVVHGINFSAKMLAAAQVKAADTQQALRRE